MSGDKATIFVKQLTYDDKENSQCIHPKIVWEQATGSRYHHCPTNDEYNKFVSLIGSEAYKNLVQVYFTGFGQIKEEVHDTFYLKK
jgi:hypothetical protein